MGKKVKKKGKVDKKEEKREPSVTKAATDDETSEDAVAVVKDRGQCCHIGKGISMDKLSSKLGESEAFRCEDCRGSVIEKRGNKGKHGKKGGTNSKSDSKAVWICLECGRFSCGGVGLPTTPQSHAVRHSKTTHHPLAVNCENPQLLWCFPCSKLINSENKEVINKIVKLLKVQPSEDVEDVWFGSGSVLSALKSGNSMNIDADQKSGYMVKGLENLGNTCFFNSVMQNLFAINTLRAYFLKLDESVGPLNASLRKLFTDTSAEAGLRVIHPSSLFGSLCTKAPQFRGYQQHDSHELLRCLLDGLSTEELSARKHGKLNTSTTDPTFVDSIFGGQISSTVTCLECKYSSTIYEPFFDLSLSVPTKKPLTKKSPAVNKSKKPKLPPKRNARSRSKIGKESVLDQLTTGGNSSGEVPSSLQPGEQPVLPSTGSEFVPDTNDIALDMGLTSQDLSAIQIPQQQSDISDSFAWLDYIDPTPMPNDIYIASDTDEISVNQGSVNDNVLQNDEKNEETNEISVNQGSMNEDVLQIDVKNKETDETSNKAPVYDDALQNVEHKKETVEIPINQGSRNDVVLQNVEHNEETNEILVNQGFMNEHPLQINEQIEENNEISVSQGSVNDDVLQSDKQNEFSQMKNQSISILHFDGSLSPGESSFKEVVQQDTADLSHSSESCYQVLSKDSNLDVENPLQVQDSEVLLLPYKEDTSSNIKVLRGEQDVSSAVVGDEQNLGLDGLGDLFNEPEVTSEPSEAVKNEVVTRRSSSDSDPDEVDSSDAPVSVESCLAYFMKPELLSKDEHAWQCENCSKILREEMIRSKRNSEISYGLEDRNSTELNDAGGNQEVEIIDGNVIYGESENKEHNMSNGSHENALSKAKDDSEVSKEEDQANSEKLKVKRDATKSIFISKAPSVLTVHLKRFSQDARGRLSKLNGHVVYKETIDLKPYMDPRCNESDKSIYRLVGVVEHLGTMRSGHYVAYIRGGNGAWFHASDSHVRQVSFEEVLRCEAYILFYEVI